MSEAARVNLRILERDYQFNCPVNEQEVLRQSGIYLNERMEAIRRSGSSLDDGRIAVMAALNMARDLINFEAGSSPAGKISEEDDQRLRQMQLKIEAALEQ